MNTEIFLVFIFSYLCGSIPFGLILTKLFLKKDIRKIGSKNIGTTNVLRTGNKFLAATTLVFDILKGYIPADFLSKPIKIGNHSCCIGNMKIITPSEGL